MKKVNAFLSFNIFTCVTGMHGTSMLQCKGDGQTTWDIAPSVGDQIKYMATAGYPNRTNGLFKCKYTIKRGPAKFIKLTFSMVDFECNGLNPKMKNWRTVNHIQITDRGKVKTIFCGKKEKTAFYTNSKEIDVKIQINAAGFEQHGARVQIMYQSVMEREFHPKAPKPITEISIADNVPIVTMKPVSTIENMGLVRSPNRWIAPAVNEGIMQARYAIKPSEVSTLEIESNADSHMQSDGMIPGLLGLATGAVIGIGLITHRIINRNRAQISAAVPSRRIHEGKNCNGSSKITTVSEKVFEGNK